jgi:AraC-like DNA-binding protein
MNEVYYYGLAALFYLTTCWVFAAVRWFHTCQEPKERRSYIWPDRKLQVLCYLCSLVLVPYVINPTDEAAWLLMKSYFPATYYFYCGLLLLCYAGTVKQWSRWKPVSWVAAIIVIATMVLPVLNAWLPFKLMSADGIQFWHYVIVVESCVMMAYCCMAMWQVWCWIRESRDANYSNPDDFPVRYASIVLLYPIMLTPLLWPAFIYDSRYVMALLHLMLAVINVMLLITVMPAWRRKTMLPSTEEDENSSEDNDHRDSCVEEQIDQIASEIRAYVEGQRAYLDPHLKIDDVVEHCQNGRTYVSMAFQRRFGSFASYINGLRLAHYEQYVAEHPNETKESAALASGFSSYNAYYRATRR